MRRARYRSFSGRLRRPAAVGLMLAAILVGASGWSCDSDAAATFRQETTSEIGEGVKTIVNAILDGLIAAIEQAGDGTADTTSGS